MTAAVGDVPLPCWIPKRVKWRTTLGKRNKSDTPGGGRGGCPSCCAGIDLKQIPPTQTTLRCMTGTSCHTKSPLRRDMVRSPLWLALRCLRWAALGCGCGTSSSSIFRQVNVVTGVFCTTAMESAAADKARFSTEIDWEAGKLGYCFQEF